MSTVSESSKQLASTENQSYALQTQKPLLLERMASSYGMAADAFKSVLLKTVFPQDKIATMEQLAAFCVVAHTYALNPLTREIYAFVGKGGGIIPILGIDGWISLVQRQKEYDGEDPFEYEWLDKADGALQRTTNTPPPGSKLVSVTATLYRKDRGRPTRRTARMEESKRSTPMWDQMPVRMLEHRAYILAARYAFGFGGLYDQDDAERILEGDLKTDSSGRMTGEIKQPQRISDGKNPHTAGIVVHSTTSNLPLSAAVTTTTIIPETVTSNGTWESNEAAVDSVQVLDGERVFPDELLSKAQDMSGVIASEVLLREDAASSEVPAEVIAALGSIFDEPAKEKTLETSKTIGVGKAKRIYAILNTRKIHTEAELKTEILAPLKLEHLHDLPSDLHEQVVKWAEGKK